MLVLVNSWIFQYESDIDKVDVNLGAISASASTGVNTLAVEFVYDGQVLSGDAFAWYVDGSGGGSCGAGSCQQH